VRWLAGHQARDCLIKVLPKSSRLLESRRRNGHPRTSLIASPLIHMMKAQGRDQTSSRQGNVPVVHNCRLERTHAFNRAM